MTPAIIPIDPKRPVTIGKTPIASFSIKPQTLLGYIDVVNTARKNPDDLSLSIWREWMMRNVVPLDEAGAPVPFSLTDALQFPACYAVKFRKLQADDGGVPGRIARDGDGLNEPCTYELGTPLSLGSNAATKEDAGSVIEIEFLIRTIGDIEPVLIANGSFEQADALIRNCGKPLCPVNMTLLRIPDVLMAAITLADGIEIVNKVLPRFFN